MTCPSDLPLHVELRGPTGPAVDVTDAHRLVLVHGFTQTGRCWGPFGDDLARDHHLVLVDAPGHGRSGHADADLSAGAGLLGESAGRGTYVGYSMGGRLALHLALARPDLVARLVLIGASAGIDDPARRAERRDSDEALAAHLLDIGVEAFVDEWLARPMFAGLTPATACRTERLTNSAEGLAASLRRSGTGAQEPLWDRLGALDAPVLLLAGVDDAKFSSLASRMARAIGPNATVALVPRAGHSAHLENPLDTSSIVRRWLRAHPVP